MEKYHDFFVASTGAAAAFIGLLFVAISIAPENVFGSGARREKQIRAQRAFIALANVFFVSLIVLIPDVSAIPVTVIAAIAIVQIGREARNSIRDDGGRIDWRNLGLISAAAYVFEICQAQRIDHAPQGLVYTVCGLYFYGLLSAWMLLQSKTDATEAAGDAEISFVEQRTSSTND